MRIVLYQFERCPYCERVRQKLKELGLPYHKINVPRNRGDSLRKELLDKSGVSTVPVIKIEDKYIGGSGEIIKYLDHLKTKENFA